MAGINSSGRFEAPSFADGFTPGSRLKDMIFEPRNSIRVTAGIVNHRYPVFIRGKLGSIYRR